MRCVTLFDGAASVPVAGTGSAGSSGDDGKATSALFNSPGGLAVHAASGDVAISDTSNNRIRRVVRPG
jgi:hypothetical protein